MPLRERALYQLAMAASPTISKSNGLNQRSPTFLAPRRSFMEENFPTDRGVGEGFGMIQVHYIDYALYFNYYYISSTSGSSGIKSWGLETPGLKQKHLLLWLMCLWLNWPRLGIGVSSGLCSTCCTSFTGDQQEGLGTPCWWQWQMCKRVNQNTWSLSRCRLRTSTLLCHSFDWSKSCG